MLSNQQVEQFKSDGFLIVENVIDTATIVSIQDEYARVLDSLYARWMEQGLVQDLPRDAGFWQKLDAARVAGVEWFQPLDISLPFVDITQDTPFHFGAAVFNLLTHNAVLDRVECLIGGELTSNPIQHVRIKPPERDVPEGEVRAHIGKTEWHQDRGVGLEEADETDIITVWIAINDATIENGCLQVLPNPPAQMYPHCPQVQTSIAPEFVDQEKAIHAEVGAGGIVLIHPLTPHCSGSNTSDGYRWSFDIRFNATGQPTGRPQFPEFVARSKSAPHTELKDWRRWKAMWEDARLRAATSPHIPQHRWQHDSPYCA